MKALLIVPQPLKNLQILRSAASLVLVFPHTRIALFSRGIQTGKRYSCAFPSDFCIVQGLEMGKGSKEKVLEQIFQLKFTSKSLVRQAKKCEAEEKVEKAKVKKAIEKGNMDGARIYAQNAIRKHNEQLNYLRLGSRLDAVVSRLSSQSKMEDISKSMSGIVKALDSALALGNMQKISLTMDRFERTFVNMEVQSAFVDTAMAGSTCLSTPEDDVNSLMHQVADAHGLEVSVALPLPQAGTASLAPLLPQQNDSAHLQSRG